MTLEIAVKVGIVIIAIWLLIPAILYSGIITLLLLGWILDEVKKPFVWAKEKLTDIHQGREH